VEIEYLEIDANGAVLTPELLRKLAEGVTEDGWNDTKIVLNIHQMAAYEQRGLSAISPGAGLEAFSKGDAAQNNAAVPQVFYKTFHFPETEVWLLRQPFRILRKIINLKAVKVS
jgi:hypothetical protein